MISFGSDQANAVRIMGFNASDAAQATGVIRFGFADGTELTHAELVQRGFDITGTSADETLRGTNLADRLAGGGSDTLIGAAGADTYTFNAGDGSDVISDGMQLPEAVTRCGLATAYCRARLLRCAAVPATCRSPLTPRSTSSSRIHVTNVATGMTPCWDKMLVSNFTRKLGPLSPWFNNAFDIFRCSQIYSGAAKSAPLVWREREVAKHHDQNRARAKAGPSTKPPGE